MKEEFKKLMLLFDRYQKGEKIDLNELLQLSTSFFANLKDEFMKADEEEKKEIMVMVNQMHAVLQAQSKRAGEMTGMTSEELNAFVKNPNNFSPEQWRMMEDTREKIFSSGKDISKHLKAMQKKNSPVGEEPPGKEGKKPTSIRKKKSSHTQRDKWMKS